MDSETPAPIHCARCGATLRAPAQFCTRCGARTAPQSPAEAAHPETTPQPEWASELAVPLVDRSQELRAVAWLYGLLLFTSLVCGLAYHFERQGDFLPWFSLVDALVIGSFAIYYRKEIVPLLMPSNFDGNAVAKLGIGAVMQFGVLGAVFYLLEHTGIPFERITDEIQRHQYSLWKLFLLASIAPAIVEEIAFRGIIFNRLRPVLGEREAWVVQAAFFSVVHLSPVIFPTHFAMGLIFGWLRMRTNSLLPGMILHGSWNAVVILLELNR